MAFDLDNEELRATRKLHKINDDLYKNEKEQEAIERLSKLVELRKNKTGEIIFDNCLCSTDDLETVIFMLREQDVPTGRAKKKKEKRNRKNSQR